MAQPQRVPGIGEDVSSLMPEVGADVSSMMEPRGPIPADQQPPLNRPSTLGMIKNAGPSAVNLVKNTISGIPKLAMMAVEDPKSIPGAIGSGIAGRVKEIWNDPLKVAYEDPVGLGTDLAGFGSLAKMGLKGLRGAGRALGKSQGQMLLDAMETASRNGALDAAKATTGTGMGSSVPVPKGPVPGWKQGVSAPPAPKSATPAAAGTQFFQGPVSPAQISLPLEMVAVGDEAAYNAGKSSAVTPAVTEDSLLGMMRQKLGKTEMPDEMMPKAGAGVVEGEGGSIAAKPADAPKVRGTDEIAHPAGRTAGHRQTSGMKDDSLDWHSGFEPGSKEAASASSLHRELAIMDRDYRRRIMDEKGMAKLPGGGQRFDEAMNRLEAVMAEADDFDPSDTVAKFRSQEAKIHAKAATKLAGQGNKQKAMEHAQKAMDVMEGNAGGRAADVSRAKDFWSRVADEKGVGTIDLLTGVFVDEALRRAVKNPAAREFAKGPLKNAAKRTKSVVKHAPEVGADVSVLSRFAKKDNK